MRETTDDREFDSRFDAAFQPGFDDSFEPVRGEPTGAAVALMDGRTDAAGALAQTLRPPRPLIDRFVIILWAVGMLLIVLGVAGFSNAMTAFSGPFSAPTPDYVVGVILAQLSPWLVSIGLATLIGTLFLLATRWEHRP